MTYEDRKTLIHFITRAPMYIFPVDKNTIISFIHGYEVGRNKECNFTKQISLLISSKFKINSSNTGWVGQIEQLSKKKVSTWVTTFTQITLEIILTQNDNIQEEELTQILKTRIQSLIKSLSETKYESGINEWLTICMIKEKWFLRIYFFQVEILVLFYWLFELIRGALFLCLETSTGAVHYYGQPKAKGHLKSSLIIRAIFASNSYSSL